MSVDASPATSSAQRVLAFLLSQPEPVTRPQIATACELSRPTVFAAAELLEGRGLIAEVGRRSGLPGRSASLYEVPESVGLVVGVDIGGSNLRVALGDARGRLLAELTEATSGSGGHRVTDQAISMIRRLTHNGGPITSALAQVGVSVPGVVAPDGATVHYAWNIGQPDAYDIRSPLAAELAAPVTLDNNVNLAAIGEQWQGAAQHLTTFAVIAIGAGVGAGIVHDGQLLRGAHGGAGEVSFLPLSAEHLHPRAASPDEAGGLMLLRKARARQDWQDHLPPTSVEELFTRAANGESPASLLVDEECQHIAAIAASICAIVDPEAIILSGGIGSNQFLVTRIAELIEEIAPFPPSVIRSSLGDRASLVGALALAVHGAQNTLLRGAAEAPHKAALPASPPRRHSPALQSLPR